MDRVKQKHIAAKWLYSDDFATSNMSEQDFYNNLTDAHKDYVDRMILEICGTFSDDNILSCSHLATDKNLAIYPKVVEIGGGRKIILCSDCGKKMQLGALVDFVDNMDLSQKVLSYMKNKYDRIDAKNKSAPKSPQNQKK